MQRKSISVLRPSAVRSTGGPYARPEPYHSPYQAPRPYQYSQPGPSRIQEPVAAAAESRVAQEAPPSKKVGRVVVKGSADSFLTAFSFARFMTFAFMKDVYPQLAENRRATVWQEFHSELKLFASQAKVERAFRELKSRDKDAENPLKNHDTVSPFKKLFRYFRKENVQVFELVTDAGRETGLDPVVDPSAPPCGFWHFASISESERKSSDGRNFISRQIVHLPEGWSYYFSQHYDEPVDVWGSRKRDEKIIGEGDYSLCFSGIYRLRYKGTGSKKRLSTNVLPHLIINLPKEKLMKDTAAFFKEELPKELLEISEPHFLDPFFEDELSHNERLIQENQNLEEEIKARLQQYPFEEEEIVEEAFAQQPFEEEVIEAVEEVGEHEPEDGDC